MSKATILRPTITLVEPQITEIPITAITGWRPSEEQLVEIGYPSLPALPAGKRFLIGADHLEWLHTKCSSASLYIVEDGDLLFSLPEEACFGQPILAYRPDHAQIFQSGFSAVVGNQHSSPDQTMSKTAPPTDKPRTLTEEDVSEEAYADAEIAIAGNINRAFDLLGWNPATACVCGIRYDNNCAHYLCNALIRAGFPAPSGGSNKKCPQGRLIRAMDVYKWCQQEKKAFSLGHKHLSNGTWIVFQQTRGSQHVCIHKEDADGWARAGTGDFRSWPTQWHYRF